MPDASQFTLGLFDSTAIGWTVATPKAEPEPDLPEPDADDPITQPTAVQATVPLGTNLYLDSDRALARGWPARARDNLAAIRLSKELEAAGRAPTAEEQALMLRFVGFGATELAQNCFPLPGATDFRKGWEQIGRELMALASPAEYAALQRATQYAHYTPEPIVRAPLARRPASRLHRRARAGARHGNRPVLRPSAGGPAGDNPAHRRRIRPDHGADRPP